MARRVFFSFDYNYVWKVNQIRSMTNIIGTAAAGFQDASLWEEAKKKGDKEIKRMIDDALQNTSVTVVCVTYGTSTRKYINYEIEKSLEKGNGLVAIQIHHLKDQNGDIGSAGAIPSQIEANGFKAYKYTNKEALARWIEEAAGLAGR
ncbi:MAG: TIR domain-containing protein [Syntrophales bacterium]